MRQLRHIILAILISSCGQIENHDNNEIEKSAKTNDSHDEIFSMTEIGRGDFDRVKQVNKPQTSIDTLSIKKQNGQFKLRIQNDKDTNLVFKDKINPNNEEADVIYNFLGHYTSIDKWLLETVYYEDVEYNLISKDGSKTSIWNVPIFSHDGKYFACVKQNGLEGEPIGLQIWKVKTDLTQSIDTIQFDKVFELNQLFFNTKECLWDIDGSLLIQAEKMKDNFYPEAPIETYYLKLKYK